MVDEDINYEIEGLLHSRMPILGLIYNPGD